MSPADSILLLPGSPAGARIYDTLAFWAEQSPERISLVAPGRTGLTYARLRTLVDSAARTLKASGLGRNDRVAVALPNGPEMAAACIAVAANATCAPLNPNYRAREFDFCLSDLNARALMVPAGVDSPARSIAERRGIRVIDLAWEPTEPAGTFTLGAAGPVPASRVESGPDDAALALHTSGTTSRPKLVSLTQRSLCVSAQQIAATLRLTAQDRCLNVMPLFHVHGLIGALMASLMVGASVVCTAGFDAELFFAWLGEFHPTWYTAVPTMHQAMLACLRADPRMLGRCSLRFIRSCSSALPPRVMREMEETFHVPVIEAYGMTEAAHQICSNPLPPGVRKEGSVGLPTGTEVAIRDETGGRAPAGEIGEVVIRSPSLMSGYAGPQSGFEPGWFATGDRGFLDAEGYLFLTGRLHETINRGGQRISPQEIESVLAEHPGVADVAAFAVPHPTLGQDVAAAVVPRVKNAIGEAEIRQFAAARLVGSKIPRRVLIVEAIPRGATGKLQRDGLAEELGVAAAGHDAARSPVRSKLSSAYASPESEREQLLAGIWQKLLRFERVGLRDNFFELGGDSLLAVQMIARAKKAGFQFTAANIFHHQTIAELAVMGGPPAERPTRVPPDDDIGAVSKPARGTLSISNSWSCLVGLQESGSKPPFFWIHGENSNAFLPHLLGPDQPVYGVLHQSRDGKQARYTSVESIAAHYLKEIQTVQPQGPYFLGGYCIGGLIAFEIAQQLRKQDQEIALLLFVDPPLPPPALRKRRELKGGTSQSVPSCASFTGRFNGFRSRLAALTLVEKVRLIVGTAAEKAALLPAVIVRASRSAAANLAATIGQSKKLSAAASTFSKRLAGKAYYWTGIEPIPSKLVNFYLDAVYCQAIQEYRARRYDGEVVILSTDDAYFDPRGFEAFNGGLKVIDIPAKHGEVVYADYYIWLITEKLKFHLEQAQAKVSAASGDAQQQGI